MEEMKWIPVTERLPEKNGKYLVAKDIYGVVILDIANYANRLEAVDRLDFYKVKRGGFYKYDSEAGYYEVIYVAHWMPLPEPPEVEE